jgi:hypothetical protein
MRGKATIPGTYDHAGRRYAGPRSRYQVFLVQRGCPVCPRLQHLARSRPVTMVQTHLAPGIVLDPNLQPNLKTLAGSAGLPGDDVDA